jgi:hypothetical protein
MKNSCFEKLKNLSSIFLQLFTLLFVLDNMKIAMKAKTLISIIAFLAAFSISATIASIWKPKKEERICIHQVAKNRQTAERITALLREDISNGRLRDGQLLELIEKDVEPSDYEAQKAVLTRKYWQSSNSIETKDLPDDFVEAWQRHMRAWGKYADFLENASETSYKQCKERKYQKEISDTWEEVLRIAKEKYGAEIPEGAY